MPGNPHHEMPTRDTSDEPATGHWWQGKVMHSGDTRSIPTTQRQQKCLFASAQKMHTYCIPKLGTSRVAKDECFSAHVLVAPPSVVFWENFTAKRLTLVAQKNMCIKLSQLPKTRVPCPPFAATFCVDLGKRGAPAAYYCGGLMYLLPARKFNGEIKTAICFPHAS